MPYLAAIVVIICMSVAATFTFFTSGAASEKYETSLLQSEWSRIHAAEIQAPKIFHIKTDREYFVLADQYNGDLLLTLLNPEDRQSLRVFPGEAYLPSNAAIALLKSTLHISPAVVSQLEAKAGSK